METLAFFCHHKCASTYISKILRQVTHSLGLTMHKEFLSQRLPLGYEKYPEQVQRINRAYNSIYKSNYQVLFHGNADNAVVEMLLKRGTFKGVHVIRDPRDLLVSAYFWHRANKILVHTGLNHWIKDRYEQLNSMPNLEAGLLLELDFCECYFQSFAEWDYQSDAILEVRFEQLISDPTHTFTQMFNFVGIPFVKQLHVRQDTSTSLGLLHSVPFSCNAAKPKVRMDNLFKANSYEIVSNGRKPGEEMIGHKYRIGKAGDWKNHFTPRVVNGFKQRYGDLLIKLGYETSNDW